MLRSYTFEQAAEKLALDDSELRFLVHHFWEFFSRSGSDQYSRLFTGADLAILERVLQMQRGERMDIGHIRQKLRHDISPTCTATRQAEFLAITSGRPGTGISTVTWNLAEALAARGARCTILDASFEAGNLDSVIPGEAAPGEWCRVLKSGVRLVSSSKLLANLDYQTDSMDEETAQELRLLDSASDFVLIDSGIGCSDTALRFAMLVDETIMLTTADVGENADCFSVVRMLRDVDPDLPLGLVINRANSLGQAREAFARINGAGRKIGLSEVPGLGWISEDEALRRCRAAGESVVESLPNSPSAHCIVRLAESLANRLQPVERRNHGGLRDLINAIGNALQRGILVRGL